MLTLAKKKAYKKLTAAEKRWNKEFKDSMREKGILPPPKPRLNRKKFLQEACNAFDELNGYADELYLRRAIHVMVSRDSEIINAEQVGVLKVMKLAAEYKSFEKKKMAEGEDSYSVGELYEKVIQPIISL